MEYIKLGAICDVINGYAFKSKKYSTSGVRIIRITNVQKGYVEDASPVYYPLNTINELKKYILYSGDLLISLTGNVGRVAILDKKYLPAFLNQRVACIRPKSDKILKEYLFYMLNTNLFEVKSINSSKGIAQKNISTEWLKNYVVPLPSIEIQQHLISILKKLEKAVRNKKHELRALDKLVKARFVEMFGDPISNNFNWNTTKLKNITSKITNGSTPKGGSKNYVNSGVMFLRSQNIWRNHIDSSDVVFISEKTNLKLQKSVLKNNDILITKTGRINTQNSSLGRAALYSGKDNSANINGHVYLIRLKNHNLVLPRFLVTILTGEAYRKYIRKVCVGGIDKRQINLNQVENFPIILPPVKKQQEFISLIQQVDKSKVAVQKSLDETQKLYDSLMQEYFG